MYKILVAGPTECSPDAPIDGNAETLVFFNTDRSQCFNSMNPQDVERCDAVIIPGGVPDVSPSLWNEEVAGSHDIDLDLDQKQLAMIDHAVKMHKPILGICRGHQVACVYFGATLIQDIGCGEYHCYNAENPCFHNLHSVPGTFMHDLYGDTLKVNSLHHQALRKIPECLRVSQFWCREEKAEYYLNLAQKGALREGSDDCIIESVYHTNYPFIGIQWHPEFRGNVYCKNVNLQKIKDYFYDMIAANEKTT